MEEEKRGKRIRDDIKEERRGKKRKGKEQMREDKEGRTEKK